MVGFTVGWVKEREVNSEALLEKTDFLGFSSWVTVEARVVFSEEEVEEGVVLFFKKEGINSWASALNSVFEAGVDII